MQSVVRAVWDMQQSGTQMRDRYTQLNLSAATPVWIDSSHQVLPPRVTVTVEMQATTQLALSGTIDLGRLQAGGYHLQGSLTPVRCTQLSTSLSVVV